MTTVQTDWTRRPLRLWPGVAAVVLQWLFWVVLPLVMPTVEAGFASVLGAAALALVIVLWWLFFSRAAWLERLGAIALMVAGIWATSKIVDESVATAGQGFMFYMYAIPVLTLAFVVWAVVTRNLSDGVRRATMVATILVACAGWALVKTSGVIATGAEFSWRWAKTPEDRLLAQADEPLGSRAALAPTDPEWPGFRGLARDGTVPGLTIETDWSASPPTELWRRPVGPGWSSFAVQGDLIYTQEQRGEEEVVSCYDATTGAPIWRHADTARFWEANGGPGPRATPTLHAGRVFTLGATGIVNALDAADGSVVWSRNAGDDTGVKVPYWGFSSSPLVVDDVVVVAAEGKLVGYDVDTGKALWLGPAGGAGHSSPHLITVDGVEQALLLSGTGAVSVTPADGTVLWEHEWKGYPITQPAQMADGDVLVNGGQAEGVRRLGIVHRAGGWTIEERWTSTRLKPYFNDFVVHEGYAYGFDGSLIACVDLANGERKWKGGRYGQGQLVLLPDQDLLLVIAEKGDLGLVEATPDGFKELARTAGLEGKTWNHPVVVGDLLLVRNAEEMAAFRLQ